MLFMVPFKLSRSHDYLRNLLFLEQNAFLEDPHCPKMPIHILFSRLLAINTHTLANEYFFLANVVICLSHLVISDLNDCYIMFSVSLSRKENWIIWSVLLGFLKAFSVTWVSASIVESRWATSYKLCSWSLQSSWVIPKFSIAASMSVPIIWGGCILLLAIPLIYSSS